jgi:aldehyde:ferredoxin oxidoreductase
MSSFYGYWGKVLHIDLSSHTWREEYYDEKWYRIYAGGGLMGTYFMLKETLPGVDPFAPENLLIFVSSVVAGLEAPGLARFSVVTKSPLSGGIAEARCEGGFGRSLKASGYDAILIHGRATHPVYLVVSAGSISFIAADDLWGLDTFDATELLMKNTGAGSHGVAVIGQAGERLVRYASIITDFSVAAQRMGTGAVMGSKNLKAVVIQPGELPEVADQAALNSIGSRFLAEMPHNTLSMWQKNAPGFSAAADLSDFDTAYIGTNNFRSDLQVANSDFTRARYMEFYRGANPCPGCPNDCIKYIPSDPNIPYQSSGIHQEVTGALGPNIGNTSLQLTLQANELCNRYGIDPVSLGFTLSFAMECYETGILTQDETSGLDLRFSNASILLPLIEMIANRQGLGDLLAEGSRLASKAIGKGADQFALHIKGIEMVSFEPRTQTNLALGYAAAPIGPRYDICEHDWDYDVVSGWEHTLELSRAIGIYERIPMQHLGMDKVRNFKGLYLLWSALDVLNICIFASAPTRLLSVEAITRLIGAITGWETSSYELMRWGERRNHIMRVYNLREGLTQADDVLPERFYNTPIDFGRLKGTAINRAQFEQVTKMLYQMFGWDQNGVGPGRSAGTSVRRPCAGRAAFSRCSYTASTDSAVTSMWAWVYTRRGMVRRTSSSLG